MGPGKRHSRRRTPQATVSGDQAVSIALGRHAGTVNGVHLQGEGDVHLQDEGDGLRWEVKPTDGKTVWEVQIDARTGAVIGDQADE